MAIIIVWCIYSTTVHMSCTSVLHMQAGVPHIARLAAGDILDYECWTEPNVLHLLKIACPYNLVVATVCKLYFCRNYNVLTQSQPNYSLQRKSTNLEVTTTLCSVMHANTALYYCMHLGQLCTLYIHTLAHTGCAAGLCCVCFL